MGRSGKLAYSPKGSYDLLSQIDSHLKITFMSLLKKVSCNFTLVTIFK